MSAASPVLPTTEYDIITKYPVALCTVKRKNVLTTAVHVQLCRGIEIFWISMFLPSATFPTGFGLTGHNQVYREYFKESDLSSVFMYCSSLDFSCCYAKILSSKRVW
jgi:hypothetical protein